MDRNQCCGSCVRNSCVSGNKTFLKNTIWKDSDNCTINECISDKDGDLFITSYRKSCPPLENCAPNDIITRDCCQFCTSRHESKFIIFIKKLLFSTIPF